MQTPKHPAWWQWLSQFLGMVQPVAQPQGSLQLPNGKIVSLRLIEAGDGAVWAQQRLHDERLLRPVEPTVEPNWQAAHTAAAWREYFRNLNLAAASGAVIGFAVLVDGQFAGQVTLYDILRGTVSQATLGYWVFSRYQGQYVATAAVALAIDYAFDAAGLHRLVATVMPDNTASRQVLRRLGFTVEGHARRNLHIDGQWQDHVLCALLTDDFGNSAAQRVAQFFQTKPGR